MSVAIHPYHEFIIKQTLNPAPRSRVQPIQTAPVRSGLRLTAMLRDTVSSISGIFNRSESIACCPAPGC